KSFFVSGFRLPGGTVQVSPLLRFCALPASALRKRPEPTWQDRNSQTQKAASAVPGDCSVFPL
ncbi:MAG: hypothetical protein SPH49_01045, partial [Dialister sp.]|nr:hypothetical protein [Dialister sp.]